jgi:hypothetical protein
MLYSGLSGGNKPEIEDELLFPKSQTIINPAEMSKMKYTGWITWITWGLIFLGVMVFGVMFLGGCKKQEYQELPFTTIANREVFSSPGGKDYQGEKPALLIITDADGISNPGLDVIFPTDIITKLKAVDYHQSFVVMVLQGKRDVLVSDMVTVTQVQWRGNRVVIHAKFPPSSAFNMRILETPSSPYHLISVPKVNFWNKNLLFVLMNGNKVVAETQHFIP